MEEEKGVEREQWKERTRERMGKARWKGTEEEDSKAEGERRERKMGGGGGRGE